MAYFKGMGVNLQELYLSPDRMTSQAWDVVAKAAKWARANHEMLQDSHWVGGDPLKPAVAYGFGSFHPAMDNGKPKFSMLMRNPNPKSISVKTDLMGTLTALLHAGCSIVSRSAQAGATRLLFF